MRSMLEALETRQLLSAGSLDPTFGVGGKVMTDFVASSNDYLRAMAVQADGKTVLGGYVSNGGVTDFQVIRLNADGTLDTTFGTGGRMLTDFTGGSDAINAVAIQSDGMIVVAGSSTYGGGGTNFALARYTASGTLDTTFGLNGKVTTDFAGGTDAAYALTLQADGKIVAAGTSFAGSTGANNFAVARYNSDGTLDASFGTGGKATVDFGNSSSDQAYAVGVQSDGSIVVGGASPGVTTGNDFGLVRFTAAGAVDVTFGAGGIVRTDIAGSTDQINALAIAADGTIVVAGMSNNAAGGGYNFALARYLSDGSLDASFGDAGKVTTDFSGSSDYAYAVAIDGGSILAGGYTLSAGYNFALARYTAAGALDATFGTAGKATFDVGGSEYGYAMAQSGGAILVGGYTNRFGNNDAAVVRVLADGSQDTTFGVDGVATVDFVGSGTDYARAVLVQADGKVVVAGYTGSGSYNFALTRYTVDGSVDTSFGINGFVTTDITTNASDVTYGAALQSDGKIVVVGTSLSNFAVARYTADGALDATFGAGGKVVTDLGGSDYAYAVVVQSDGKIVAGGYTSYPNNNFALVRYETNGALDATFGTGGKVITDWTVTTTTYDYVTALALEAGGKIVAAGRSSLGGGGDNFAVARYNADGTLDTSFGAGGKVTTDFGLSSDYGTSVATLPTGQILVGGYTFTGSDFALVRYNANGELDASFGVGGKVTTNLGSSDYAYAMTVQADGKILLAGTSLSDFAVMRYLPDGTLDAAFGTGGNVTVDFGGGSDQVYAIAIGGGRIYVVGNAYSGSAGAGGYNFGVAAIEVGPYDPLAANAGGPYSIGEGSTATLSAGRSTGAITSYAWDLDADGIFGETGLDAARGNEVGVTVAFSGSGLLTTDTWTVSLRVSDASGSSTASTTVTFYNVPPTVSIGGPASALEGTPYVLALSAVDAGANTVSGWTIDWGDGNVEAIAGNPSTAGHTYPDGPASYVIRATVTDADGTYVATRAAVIASPGSLDTSFGTGGRVNTDFISPTSDYGRAVAVQADGKVLVAGYATGAQTDFALTRLNVDGSVDTTFGNGGRVTTDVGTMSSNNYDQAYAVTVLADGKILVAGTANYDFAVVRYTADGVLDTTFGTKGKAIANIGSSDYAYAMAVQADGSIVLGGYTTSGYNFAMVRFTAGGVLDTSFGTAGKVVTDLGGTDQANAITLQADGKIVLAGQSRVGSYSNFAAVRYNADGSVDTSFGVDGKVSVDFANNNDIAWSVASQSDGKLLLGGMTYASGSYQNFGLIRLMQDGTLDATFGTGGKVTTDVGSSSDTAYAMHVGADDRIVLAGTNITNMMLARYSANGALDATFGTGGKVTIDLGGSETAYGLALDGTSLVVAGYTSVGTNFAVARVTETGALDSGFGTGGKATVGFVGSNSETIRGVATQSDGRIVAVGSGGGDFVVARYNADGTLDATFGVNGQVITDLSISDSAYAVAIQPDGKILVAGMANYNFGVVRYNVDGSLDTSFGTGGKALVDVYSTDTAYAMTLLANGKILIGGTSSSNFSLIRLNANGMLDTAFGGAGKVTTDFGGSDVAYSLAVQEDGKIVLAGTSSGNFALARYSANGVLDATFGVSGKTTTDFAGFTDTAMAVTIWGDRIILIGHSQSTSSSISTDIALAGYTLSGVLDTTFGVNGKVTVDMGSKGTDYAYAALAQGQMLTVGGSTSSNATLVRFRPDGSLDKSFGQGGRVISDLGGSDYIYALALAPDGSIVAAGSTTGIGTGNNFAVVRYQSEDLTALTAGIANASPVITVAGAATTIAGTVYSVSLGATDTGTDTITGWTINWGDGTSDVLPAGASGASHVYVSAGAVSITATVTDEDGTFTSSPMDVVVGASSTLVAVSGADTSPEGAEYTLTLSATTAVTGWTIAWGDGTTSNLDGTATSATHAFADGGKSHVISTTATDGVQTFVAAAKVVAISNVTPTIAVTGAGTATEGSAYSLELGAVTDPGADTVSSYIVHWGDGTSSTYDTAGVKTHTYVEGPGSATITVDLVDEDGTWAGAGTLAVEIANAAPTATLGNSGPIAEGSSATISFGSVVDSPADTAAGFTYSFDVNNDGDFSDPEDVSGSSESTHTVAFADNGTYTIRGRITDRDGGFTDITTDVTVSNAPPTLRITGPATIMANMPYELALTASDAGADTLDHWTINWGDGQSDTVPAGTPMVSHMYAAAGNVTITATGTDEDGTYTALSNQLVHTVSLVKDINAATNDASVTYPTVFNGALYFSASDGVSGTELWRSDGTAAGTYRVKDIAAGSNSSLPSYLTVSGGMLYFTASSYLWKTDGTEAGTVQVKSISSANNFCDVNGTLFFTAYDSGGQELWKSDGTSAGTVRVADIRVGSGASNPTGLVNVGGTLFFRADRGTEGVELWKSDGTEMGTVLVSDIYAGFSSSSPTSLTAMNGIVYFAATDMAGGSELWRSDGTAEGTYRVKSIYAGTSSASPANLTVYNGELYFSANDGTSGTELWKTDGTEAGTVRVYDVMAGSSSSYPTRLTVSGGSLYFGVSSALWKTDGTAAGTMKVSTLVGSITNAADVDGTLYLAFSQTATGTELWKISGTGELVLVKDIFAGKTSSSPGNFKALGGGLIFTADDPDIGIELWTSNGTEAGTQAVKDLNATLAGSSISTGVVMNNVRYFSATDVGGGAELWRSDGTPGGTYLLKDICPGATGSSPTNFAVFGGYVYFSANDGTTGTELWRTDGTEAGTVLVKEFTSGLGGGAPTLLTVSGPSLYMVAGGNLWRSDGTDIGSVQLSSGISSVSNLVDVNGTVFFTASQTASGIELWKSDGTQAGTVRVKDIAAATLSSSPANLRNVNGMLLFVANDYVNGTELWRSDGTEAGTVMVKDIWPGGSSSSIANPKVFNGVLYFSANDGVTGGELWRSDGTTEGTYRVKDLIAGSSGYTQAQFTISNGSLFFTSSNALWKTDGTEAGTVSIKSIGYVPEMCDVNGTLFISAPYGSLRELWVSDGTAAGTKLLADIWPGTPASNPYSFTALDGTLLFAANDGVVGAELWRSTLSNAPTLQVSVTAGAGFASLAISPVVAASPSGSTSTLVAAPVSTETSTGPVRPKHVKAAGFVASGVAVRPGRLPVNTQGGGWFVPAGKGLTVRASHRTLA